MPRESSVSLSLSFPSCCGLYMAEADGAGKRPLIRFSGPVHLQLSAQKMRETTRICFLRLEKQLAFYPEAESSRSKERCWAV